MKRLFLSLCVSMAFFSAVLGYARGDVDDRGHRGRRFKMRGNDEERELDQQERRSELQFQQQKREMKLEKMRRSMKSHGERRGGFHPKRAPRFGHGGHYPFMRSHHRMRALMILPFLFFCGIVHILLAVWVYQDVRKRDSDSGIWIVITLLIGPLGAGIYAITRIGDAKK
ncbi:MAG: hypothetical protein KAG97_13505 [Victivallales bacterium]|nr:hypothetical protein [Victivallales bacterium]